MHYRTEITIPIDRYVCIQVPDYLPEGRAVITILVEESDAVDSSSRPEDEDRPDVDDVEWWDEFDGESPPTG